MRKSIDIQIKESRADIFSVIAAVNGNKKADVNKISKQTGIKPFNIKRILRLLEKLGMLRCRRLKQQSWINFSNMIQPPLNFTGTIYLINLNRQHPPVLEEDVAAWIVEKSNEPPFDRGIIIKSWSILVTGEYRLMMNVYAESFSSMYAFERLLISNPAVSFTPLHIVYSTSIPALMRSSG